ncbi:MAG TPA: FAD-dependent oxidoreductase [Candidatus Limnocylindrales bacterium]
MANPVILVVDDDPQVLRAVERELRGRFGGDYRIVAAGSGPDALDAVRRLTLRGTPVALLVVDQRMPGMTGVEFLAASMDLLPGTKRALLTAYADTDVAIRAINEIGLDQYLLKPWDPPDERLFPALAELLDDWRAGWIPPFEGIRLVGHRWSARAHEIKDYLARNQVPYRWVDVEADPEAARLVASAGIDPGRDPLLVFPDGSHLRAPTNMEIAGKVGLRTHAALPSYDLVIVGGGPAGLAAAVYGASEGLRTLLLEREAPGGQAGTTSRIENYLGFPAGLTGADLARRAVAQATRLGAEILTPQEVRRIRREDPYSLITLGDGTELSCQALILAMGVQYRRLEAPGVDGLIGLGVFYGAAITEALAYRDHDVAVVGGGNSAGQAAVYLAGFARHVTLVVRGGSLEAGMSQYLVDQIASRPNLTVRLSASVAAVRGADELEAITIADAAGTAEVPMQALFLFVGALPRTDWLEGLVERDGAGFIVTGTALSRTEGRVPGWPLAREPFLLETNVPGIFAAGDVRARSVKRIASGVGEGAMAVQFVHQHLAGL